MALLPVGEGFIDMDVPLSITARAFAVVVTAFAILIIKSPSRNRIGAYIAAGVAIIVISLPVTFWLTIMLFPFCGWIEAT